MGAPSCSHVFFSCALRCLAELASSPISLLCSITCGITRGRRTEDLPPGGFLDGEREFGNFFSSQKHIKNIMKEVSIIDYVGVSLNGGTPKTPQNDHV